jgi:probable F420-dependent oxidoreductase
MRVDGRIDVKDLRRVAGIVAELEKIGFDGAFAGEAAYDPFLQVAIAGEHSTRLELGSGVAIALARNPMQTAQTAHDLQAFTQGRFILGLGSQVRAHIERRYGATWSRPVDRMREFVLAVRAIWRSWNERVPLHFEGEFYRHTLMNALFDPGPNPFGPPRVFLAAIGPRMAEAAGSVADGLLMHSFVTDKYLRDVMLPAVDRGLAASGRDRSSFEISATPLLVTGSNEREGAAAERVMREHLAFYGSTPTYRRVLAAEGWGDLQPELNALLKAGRSSELPALISSDVMDRFVVRGSFDEIPERLVARFGGFADRVIFRGPYGPQHGQWALSLQQSRAPT